MSVVYDCDLVFDSNKKEILAHDPIHAARKYAEFLWKNGVKKTSYRIEVDDKEVIVEVESRPTFQGYEI